LKGIAHWVSEAQAAWEVPRDLLLRRYPPFVTGGDLPRGHVPVFVFHSVAPAVFGRRLQYLADNGYRTLSVQEYLDVLTGARPAPERAVVLTFDDGRASVVTAGLPLLQKHGMKAVMFLVPARLRADGAPVSAEGPDEGFMSWAEVDVLERSGLFDLQSHSLTHARVHTAPHVAGFLRPQDQVGYRAMDVPLVRDGETDRLAADAALGTPLLRAASRTDEALRFYEEPALREACVARVCDGGGADFFRHPGWERTLREAVAGVAIRGRVESPQEREQAIRRELAESKRQIEERTGRPVTHLCYPWHASGPTSRRLAAELGYRTAFCGKVPGVRLTPVGGDPLAIARIGEDYVELLPGRGRARLGDVLRRKWGRRFGQTAR
jgi:peptidoglycan/xylan/chitin deacetylase (PgdA/CDA1 family)